MDKHQKHYVNKRSHGVKKKKNKKEGKKIKTKYVYLYMTF